MTNESGPTAGQPDVVCSHHELIAHASCACERQDGFQPGLPSSPADDSPRSSRGAEIGLLKRFRLASACPRLPSPDRRGLRGHAYLCWAFALRC